MAHISTKIRGFSHTMIYITPRTGVATRYLEGIRSGPGDQSFRFLFNYNRGIVEEILLVINTALRCRRFISIVLTN